LSSSITNYITLELGYKASNRYFLQKSGRPYYNNRRYDAVLYIDKTYALHSLHMQEVKEDEDLPETFPTGL
jgi:hypothetical protein